MTTIDMDSRRKAIALEFVTNERWPGDLPTFLRTHVDGAINPELDRWGTPYELQHLPEDPVLVSCGPDRECGTEDDIVSKIFAKRPRPGGSEGPATPHPADRLS